MLDADSLPDDETLRLTTLLANLVCTAHKNKILVGGGGMDADGDTM